MPTSRDPVPALYEHLLPESAEELFEHAPCGYLATLPDGTIVRVNETFLAWTGYTRDELLGRRRFQELLTVGGRIYYETHVAPLLRIQGAISEIALEVARPANDPMPALVNATLREDEDGTPALIRITVFDARGRRAYEEELLRARNAERAARERTERLWRITSALATTLDSREVAARVLDELADGVSADAAAIGRLHPDGRLDIVVRRESPAGPRADAALELVGRCARAGRSHFAEDEPPGAVAVLPLVFDRRTIGAVWLVFGEPRAFPDDERAFLLAGAAQSAQGLERALVFEQQRHVAHQLQQSMLAGSPPRDPRMRIAAHYQPGVEALEVGGDWHDTFRVTEDTIAIAVGDVVGRGLRSATAMGQLRSAVRALGVAGHGPARTLEHLDAFVAQAEAARSATLAYAEVDLATGTMRLACAGHPPPVVVAPGDEPRLLWEGRSPPLGANLRRASRDAVTVALEPGTRLVLYTDGLVERRGEPIDDGLERLLREVGARRAGTPAELVEQLPEALVLDRHGDDVCLLCLELRPGEPAPGNPGARGV